MRSSSFAELKEAAAQRAVMQAREALERLSAIARREDDEQLGAILRALELIGKHHKLFTDKLEVSNHGLADRLKEALERVDGEQERPDRDPPRRAHARRSTKPAFVRRRAISVIPPLPLPACFGPSSLNSVETDTAKNS